MSIFYKFLKKIFFILNDPYPSIAQQNYNNASKLCEYDSTEFVKFEEKVLIKNSKIKYIAFYLTQFHKTEENDLWWGENYTEWTAVTKAVPRYAEQYQPQLPIDIGFYNLLDINTWQQQIKIANNYGIDGFCFYFYWFNGKRLLHKPLDLFLNNKHLNINFCLFWANETWSRTWHGFGDSKVDQNEILIQQNHHLIDDENFMKYLCNNIFIDNRYIFVGKKPLLIIYKPKLFPDIKKTVELWQNIAKSYGYNEGIHLSYVLDDSKNNDPSLFKFHSATQFSPYAFNNLKNYNKIINFVEPCIKEDVFDYNEVVAIEHQRKFNIPVFRTTFPSWDNEARKPKKSRSFYKNTPELFRNYLMNMSTYALNNPIDGSSIVFINAWNEWAEGAHLEPDIKYGYAWLDQIYKVKTILEYSNCNIQQKNH